MKNKINIPLINACILGATLSSSLSAQISYDSASSTYSQDFDTFSPSAPGLQGQTYAWTDNTSITGWYSTDTTFTTSGGVANAGAILYGTSDDRTVGSFNLSDFQVGAQLTNNTSMTLTEFTVSYIGEQWYRVNNVNATEMSFQYSLDATSLSTGTWTDVGDLTFTSPQVATVAGSTLDGNLSENQVSLSATISSIVWSEGSDLWIRWSSVDNTGAEAGMAIDNMTFTATVPEPSSYALALGIVGLVMVGRRCSKA
ncbi:hypothetical protein ACWPKO_11955 [Coraliomargarita sp. W4R53]